jgi:hypothetical protein
MSTIDQLGALVKTLRDCGLAESTLVLFTADHGDMLGERGLWYKMTWHENAARVPLIVALPGDLAPRRVKASVSTIDLLPTLTEIAGDGRASYAAPIDGRSLLPHLSGTGGHDEVLGEYFAEGAVDSAAAEIEHRRSRSFMDGLRYDLDIDATGGNTEIRMIFNPVTSEELDASLDGRFTITGDGTRWTGELSITRAYYNFFKRFDATGSIRYTGDFLNPELNITATYQGTRTLDTSATVRPQEKVVVTVKITGTRREPKVEFGMTINDIDYYTYTGPTSHDLQSDAISFIVAERDVANQIQSTAGYSLATGASSVLTGQLTQFLKNQGLDVNVELNVNTRETTELRLSGTALSGYWHYGGTILNDPLANANISILYSLGTIFDSPALRNLMLELERRVEPGVLGINNDLKRINSARMFYRFSF